MDLKRNWKNENPGDLTHTYRVIKDKITVNLAEKMDRSVKTCTTLHFEFVPAVMPLLMELLQSLQATSEKEGVSIDGENFRSNHILEQEQEKLVVLAAILGCL